MLCDIVIMICDMEAEESVFDVHRRRFQLGVASLEAAGRAWEMPFVRKMKPKRLLLALLIACPSGLVGADLMPDRTGFDQKQSSRCFGSIACDVTARRIAQKPKLRFDSIDPDIVDRATFRPYGKIVREAFNAGEMPPEDEPQPTIAERDADWSPAGWTRSSRRRSCTEFHETSAAASVA